MSELREVELKIDAETFENVLKSLGYKVYRYINIAGWSTAHIKGEVVGVIKDRGYELGVGVKNGRLIFDDWRGIVKEHLDEKILPEYYKEVIEKRLRGRKIQTRHTKNELVFVIE